MVLYRPVFSLISQSLQLHTRMLYFFIKKSVIEYCIGRDEEGIFMVFAWRN